jgi:hypothetical protein
MLPGRKFVALILLLVLVRPSPGQESTASTVIPRDAKALSLVQSVIQGLGGAAFYSASSGVIAQGTVTAVPAAVSGPIIWEWAGPEFKYQRPGPTSPIVFVSGHGNPAIVDSDGVHRGVGNLALVSFPVHVPSVALSMNLANASASVGTIQMVAVNGENTLTVSFVDQTSPLSTSLCRQTWYFDATTLLPFRVDYLTTNVYSSDTIQESSLLSDYRNVSGISIPFHIVTFFNGQQIEDVSLSSVQVGYAPSSTDFEAVSGVSQ